MRQRAYYSLDEIVTGLYTFGGELMYETGVEYVGPYHRYITGEIYTQPDWDDALSVKLLPYEDVTTEQYQYKKLNSIKTTYQTFISKKPNLTKQDYDDGIIYRYFIKKVNESLIYEVEQNDYINWTAKKIDPNLYVAVELPWIIAGNLNDAYEGPVLIPGVVTQNQQIITEAEKTISGISKVLNNLTEFYTDTEYTVPPDINP